MSRDGLIAAINQAMAAATAIGADPSAAAQEARTLAAAVAEANRGAYLDWCLAVDVAASAQAFMDAAVKGRRYRAAPTPLAQVAAQAGDTGYGTALGVICSEAAELGEPAPSVHQVARIAAAAQLAAPTLRDGAADPSDQAPDPRSDPAQQEFLRQAPTILEEVLDRLSGSQQSLLDLGRLDPHAPGAFPGLGAPQGRTGTGAVNGFASTEDAGESAAATPPAPRTASTGSQPAAAAPAEAEPPTPTKTVEEWLAELDELTGLAKVKAEIRRQTAILRIDALRTKAGLKSPTITRHLIFTGNPGTGKTTVARLVAGIYQAIGLLSKGQLVEVDRSELVAGYLGQTAIKTAEVTAKAYGGVLFIDEAYALNGDQYGEEAINTLVKEMEDHREDLVVIVAGYPEPMTEFITNNPGLASRFRTTIEFENYTDQELQQIFTGLATKSDFDLADGCLDEFDRQLSQQTRDENFGNGRFARNLLEAAIGRHAWRLRDIAEPSLTELRTLLPIDLLDPDAGAPTTPAPLAAPDGAALAEAVEFPAPAPEE